MTPKQAGELMKYAVAASVAAELDQTTSGLWQRHLTALDYADAEPALRAWVAGHRWCSTLAELLAACGLGDVAEPSKGIAAGVAHAMCADAARKGWRLSRATGVPDPGEESPRAGWLAWDPSKPPPYTVRLARVVAGRPEYEPSEQQLDRLALAAPVETPEPDESGTRSRPPMPEDVRASIREKLSRLAAKTVPEAQVPKSPGDRAALDAELSMADARFQAELARAQAAERGELSAEEMIPY